MDHCCEDMKRLDEGDKNNEMDYFDGGDKDEALSILTGPRSVWVQEMRTRTWSNLKRLARMRPWSILTMKWSVLRSSIGARKKETRERKWRIGMVEKEVTEQEE